MRRLIRPLLAAVAAVLLLPGVISAQTRVEPGFNLLSEEQDVEIGRESARQIESELPMLDDRVVTRYVDQVGSRLAEQAPGYDYPYQFEVVNVDELNAFALPGGFMYVNRGLLTRVGSESELAGVMAHEIAHVALRHGTNQASKAYIGQSGLSLLSGLIGGRTASDVVGVVGGFGLNSLFLKYSRDDEREADIVGAQILARAGYDPRSLSRVFSTLRAAADESGGTVVPTFFSSHPPYDERVEIVQREADRMGDVRLRRPIGDLESVQSRLASMPEAESMDRYVTDAGAETDRDEPTGTLGDVRIEPPSDQWDTYTHPRGYYRVSTPSNWLVREATDHFGVTFVPRGGALELADGREEIVYGVMIDHFSPDDLNAYGRRWGSGFVTEGDWDAPSDSADWLERASEQLVDTLRGSNPHLTVAPGTERFTEIDQGRAYLVTLAGHNPVTERAERVTVVTRETDGDGHLVYALLIAPEEQWTWMTSTFERMMNSLQVDDHAVHRSDS